MYGIFEFESKRENKKKRKQNSKEKEKAKGARFPRTFSPSGPSASAQLVHPRVDGPGPPPSPILLSLDPVGQSPPANSEPLTP
jgi:hypothetical protein